MKVYTEHTSTITQTQYHDPLLTHISYKIASHLKLKKGGTLLDLGCGVGRTSLLAASLGYYVVGIDIERKAIKLANLNAKILGLKKCRFIHGDILKHRRLYSHQTFDAIVCSEVIEHVRNPKAIIDLAFKLLKQDGLFILTTPHDQKQWSVLDEYAQHVKRFHIEEIKQLLSDFKILHLYTLGFPFMKIIIRTYNLLAKKTATQHSAAWRQNKAKNIIYYAIARNLLKLDDMFNSFSKGTTIIAVAVK